MTKILLVEDDKNLREIYGVRLGAEGYQIVTAGDGEEALAVAIKERPNLIISDVMMPKISGFDMLDILRSTTETKNIKVIMMTALSSEEQRARGESLGADKYLVKSQVGIEDVIRTVHEVLGDGATSAVQQSTAVASGNTAEVNPPQNTDQGSASVAQPMNPSVETSTTPNTTVQSAYAPDSTPVPTTSQDPSVLEISQPSNLESTSTQLVDQPVSEVNTPLVGGKIIEPVSNQNTELNIADMMNQELTNTPTTQQLQTPTTQTNLSQPPSTNTAS